MGIRWWPLNYSITIVIPPTPIFKVIIKLTIAQIFYNFNINTGFSELPKAVFFNNENISEEICFSFRVDKQGISEQVVVEYKDKLYDFMDYFTNTKVYATTSEMMDEKQRVVKKANIKNI